MIPKSSKFPLRTELLRFRTSAKQTAAPHFRTLFAPHSPSRLAVVVPKKLSKLASSRNWLKRLTYDTLWPQIIDKKLDVVIIYKPLLLKKSLATKQLIISELGNLKFGN